MEAFKIIGVTPDGSPVVSGLFRLYDTTGLPLFMLWDRCIQNGFMPSWIDFYKEASAAGWKHKTIMNRLNESLVDAYGAQFRDEVLKRLEFLSKTDALK